MIDRETLLYQEPAYSVSIWFDFMPGLLSRGRVLPKSSIQQWGNFPTDHDPYFPSDKQDEIIEKVRKYWSGGTVEVA